MRAIVFATNRRERMLAGRSLRALAALGVDALDATIDERKAIGGEATWLVRGGAWPLRSAAPHPPEASATKMALIGVGAIEAADEAPPSSLGSLLAHSGGDLTELARARRLPPLASAFVDETASHELVARIAGGVSISVALEGIVESGRARVVRLPALDVLFDPRLRVVLAVSSLQRGGAEQVVADLSRELGERGIFTLIATLGAALRTTLPEAASAIDLACGSRADRALRLARLATFEGVDLVHAHLVDADLLAPLHDARVPVVATAHNTRAAWPRGFERGAPALTVACSNAVARDLRDAGVGAVRRTIWNGIDAARFRSTEGLARRGRAFRARHRIGEGDLAVVAIANPRPQKRLERLPAILRATERLVGPRKVFMIWVGDAAPRSEDGVRALEALEAAIDREGVGDRFLRTGLLDDVAPVLAASDVLVSTSAHEGLSLAQLEALAAGVSVVTTDVGGASEVLAAGGDLHLVDVDASPEIVARAIDAATASKNSRIFPAVFTRKAMAARHAEHYAEVVSSSRRRAGRGLLLVTNNFSIGGAQSSARRLLTKLAARGHHVRAAVLEEQRDFPTPGRRALGAAGIAVTALPRSDGDGGRAATRALCALAFDDPPRAVVFWNALAPVKIRVADALLDVPVFDVSPGEMLFASLDRFFEKRALDLPYLDARGYGALLAGVVVKYAAEGERAREVLGAPVFVVPNGVELGSRSPKRAPNGRLRIGTAARIAPQKKLEELLAAIRLARSRLGDFEIVVAGGPERGSERYAEALRACASDLPIRWLGDVDDTRGFLETLDVFAMVSEPAGCPNASLEAMAAGLPIVATDVGGASEQLAGGAGLLVPRADAAAFADALALLAADPARRDGLAEAARARAEACFSAERMADDYSRLLGLIDAELPSS